MKNACHCLLVFILLGCGSNTIFAQTLEVGPGKAYPDLTSAAGDALPGDTILIFPGNYSGGMFINALQGTADAWITIRGLDQSTVIVTGGNNAIQFSDPAYLVLERLTFREQTGNGLNIDDGGSFDTPAHHIRIRHCIFEDIDATGNNDLLKMSGVDTFWIEHCIFQNGAAGGSGVDMVGCHIGEIYFNHFENLGSNSIQAKGGTRYIKIYGNHFIDGGQRTLNLGGSTGAAFFRPAGANYEAADLDVYANIIEGSWAAIAYVGSQRVRVWQNTIYQPQNWVMRILQESGDTSFYQAASHGEFVNNIIVVNSSLSTATNIGPNTNPKSFFVGHNIWYHLDNPGWNGPFLPVAEVNGLIQVDPLFVDAPAGNFQLMVNSPAIGAGLTLPDSTWRDFIGKKFLNPPSSGAFEGGTSTGVGTPFSGLEHLQIYPNPTRGYFIVEGTTPDQILIFDATGSEVYRIEDSRGHYFDLPDLPSGTYTVLTSTNAILKVGVLILIE
jgi:hypothetical protein